jgi:hypothetical protein
MKKLLLSCVVLFLLNILHINQSQAQNWQNSLSVTLHTPFPTDAYAQKVKVYNNDYLVGITKKEGVDHYGFVLWHNTDNYKNIALLNTADIIINDFTFLGDTLFFCGKKLTIQGNYVGIIGYFNMNDFINNNTFQYRYTHIFTVGNLTKILINQYNTGDIILSAIGNGSAQIIHINLANLLNAYQNPFPTLFANQSEIIFDMFYSQNQITTVSKLHPSDQYVIRYFGINGQYLQNTSNYIYTFPNIYTIYTSDPEDYPLHIANVSQDTFAVCLSVSDGQRDFTMINFHKKLSHHIFSSQLLRHYDKNHTVLEMEYSTVIDKLLLLNDSYFNGQGKIQTMTYIDPWETNPYVTLMENFNTPSTVNHFSLISPKHYAVAGTYSFSQTNNLQLFATKYINSNNLSCLNNLGAKVEIHTPTSGSSFNSPSTPQSLNLIWIMDSIYNNVFNLTLDCID